jgi:arsenate reductase
MIIYFNPDCSKCNEALDLLKQNHCELNIRNYLTEPPAPSELKELLHKLQCTPLDIVRKKEPLFIEKFEGRVLRMKNGFIYSPNIQFL